MAVLMYLAAVVIANLTVAAFGPSAVVVNAFLFIGLDLTLRDRLHDQWSGDGLAWKMGALIVTGGAISWVLNRDAGQIAVASSIAFAGAAIADGLAYQAAHHWPRLARINASNVVGSAVDSLLFPTIAFGSFLPALVLAQFAAKVAGGFIWSLVLTYRSAPIVEVALAASPVTTERTGWHRWDCPDIWGYGCDCGGDQPRPR